MKKKLISSILTLVMILVNVQGIVFAESQNCAIVLPASVQNGTFTVTKGGEILQNGDMVTTGDTVNFVSTPADGYGLFSGTNTGEKTLTDDDFFVDVTKKLNADSSIWQTEKIGTDYDAVTGDGFYHTSPRPDYEVYEQQTITYEPGKTGEQRIRFDWSVNQGTTSYGLFILNFYVNGDCVITHNFETTANDSKNILKEDYTYTANTTDVLKWEFKRTYGGWWADNNGRVFYLGNVKIKGNTYEPEIPVFRPVKTVNVDNNIANGTVSVDNTQVIVGKMVTITANPEGNGITKQVTVTDSNNNPVNIKQTENGYTFIMPESDVTVSAEFVASPMNIATSNDLLDFIRLASLYPTIDGNLTADINMGGAEITSVCPNGDVYYNTSNVTNLGYQGIFNGNYHKISNYTVTKVENQRALGLFGNVSGTIKNIVIDHVTINKNTDVQRYSALCGQLLSGGLIENCVVKNSTIELNGGDIAGTVAGCNYGGTIRNSVSINNTVNAHGRSGNLVGDNQNDNNSLCGTVENCYSTSSVVGTQSGKVSNYQGNISDMYKMAYRLNTVNGTQTNNGLWSADDNCPVHADANNKAVYKTTTPEGDKYLKAGSTFTLTGNPTYANMIYNNEVIAANANGNYDITVAESDGEVTIAYIKYNVTLNTDDGIINSGNVTEYSAEKDVELPTDVTKNGYVFKGWYDNNEFNGSPITSISKDETGDKVYYAKYILIKDLVAQFEAITDKDNIITNLDSDWSNVPSDSASNTPAEIRSKEIGDRMQSVMTFTVTIPENTSYVAMFDYYVSSETSYDYFTVHLDDNQALGKKSGDGTRGDCVLELKEGQHTIKFIYSKDYSDSSYEDMAKISNLVFEKIDGDCKILSVDFDTPSATIVATTEKTATLIFAAYDSKGMLISTDIQNDKQITVGKNSYAPTSGFTTVGADKISVMLWKNLTSIKPI